MNILIVSDSPRMASSYGQQTRMLAPRLARAGHKVTIYGPSEHGTPLDIGGVQLVGGLDAVAVHGAEMIDEHARHFKADVVLTLKDPYVFPVDVMKQLSVPWIAVCPVDTEPLCGLNAMILQFASAVLAIAPNGEQVLRQAGFDPFYTPLGVSEAVFKPDDKQAVRKKRGLPVSEFVAAFVGDNRTAPSRKNLEHILMAWAVFIQKHPSAILVLHTLVSPLRGGLDIMAFADALGVPPTNLAISDQYQYIAGCSPGYVANIYQTADVLLLPSTGEGFGLPLIESQLCGVPAIATKWTAMRDQVFVGALIDAPDSWGAATKTGIHEYQPPAGGWRFRAHPQAIVEALEVAVQHPASETLVQQARRSALQYSIDRVVPDHWLPVLARLENILVKGKVHGGFSDVQPKGKQNGGVSKQHLRARRTKPARGARSKLSGVGAGR